MQIMMTLLGNAPSESIDAYLRNVTHVISCERLGSDGVIASSRGDEVSLERTTSELRAVWILDVPSRTVAVDLARNAPGEDGMLEIRELFTPADFGAPDPEPATPPPPPPTKDGHLRYIAFVRTDHLAESGALPTQASMERMDVYCNTLAETQTMLGGVGLKTSAKGSRVRRRAEQRFVLDGPFTESKELVGGYLLLQAPSLDEAVQTILPWLAIHRAGQGVDESHIEVRRLV
jgi:hypothetical protein